MISIFKNSKVFSDTILDVNEDIAYCGPDFAWVLDGATPLYNKNTVDVKSDAKWFVEQWKDFLLQNINDQTRSLSEIVAAGINEIKNRYQYVCGETAEKVYYPSASCSIVRTEGNKLSFFILGDCETIFQYIDNSIVNYSDSKLKELDKISLSVGINAKNKCNKDFIDCLESMQKILRENRNKINTESGYWNLGCDMDAVTHAIKGDIKTEKLKSVSLMSDGFYQYYDTFKLTDNINTFVEKIKQEKAWGLYEELVLAQKQDGKLNKFPRFKLSDDSSLVYFEL